jgi:Flp pilus assembly pilin Flp
MACLRPGDNLSAQETTMAIFKSLYRNKLWQNQLWQNEQGQDMTEYALMGGLVATVAVAIMPDIFSIVAHINELLLAALQCALGITLN